MTSIPSPKRIRKGENSNQSKKNEYGCAGVVKKCLRGRSEEPTDESSLFSKDLPKSFWIGVDDFHRAAKSGGLLRATGGTKTCRDYTFLRNAWSRCGVWPRWEGKKKKRKRRDACLGFLCAFQLCSVLDDENIHPEYPEEQGQFSPGVNSKESLQETLEMDCRMESLPLSHLPSVLRDCIHSLQ